MKFITDPEEALRLARQAEQSKQKEPMPPTNPPANPSANPSTTRPSTAIPTPGMANKKEEEPVQPPEPAQPPPPPANLVGNRPLDLVENQAENRATAFRSTAPYNPYASAIEHGDEESRDVLRERDKEDHAYAQEMYYYNPESGMLFSKTSRKMLVAKTGDRKRKVVTFRKRKVYQHDLAYLMMVGHWPEEPLRHVGDTRDNSWNNLRLRSQWSPAMKPTVQSAMSDEEIEAKAAVIPKHVQEGRRYPLTVQEIVDAYEFRAEGTEGVLISKRTGKEVAKPKENSKGRHRVVFVTALTQIRAHIISYVLYYREFPKGNLGARDGNKCNIHPANLKPLWQERKDA